MDSNSWPKLFSSRLYHLIRRVPRMCYGLSWEFLIELINVGTSPFSLCDGDRASTSECLEVSSSGLGTAGCLERGTMGQMC